MYFFSFQLSLPALSTSLSRSLSKTFRSDQFEKASEGWPTQKDFYAQVQLNLLRVVRNIGNVLLNLFAQPQSFANFWEKENINIFLKVSS